MRTTIFLLAAAPGAAADLEFAHKLYRESQYGAAAKEYQAFVAEKPADAQADEARFFLAECWLQTGAAGAALPLYERLSKPGADGGRAATALLRSGLVAQQLGQGAKAEAALRRFVAERPQAAERVYAWNTLGEIGLAAGDGAAAKNAFAEARRAAPADHPLQARVALGRARALALAGERAGAEAGFAALADGPDAVADDAAMALGELLYGQKDFAAAAARFAALADRAGPLAGNARFNAGLAFEKAAQFDAAAAQYRKTGGSADAELAPAGLGRLARLERRRKNFPASRAAAQKLIEAFPSAAQRGDAELLLAFLDGDEGRGAEARAALELWLTKHPGHAQTEAARQELARLAAAGGSLAEIEAAWRAANNPAAKAKLAYQRGAALYRLKRPQEALDALPALDGPGMDGATRRDARLVRGLAFAALGQRDAASADLLAFLGERAPPALRRDAAETLGAAISRRSGRDLRALLERTRAALAEGDAAFADVLEGMLGEFAKEKRHADLVAVLAAFPEIRDARLAARQARAHLALKNPADAKIALAPHLAQGGEEIRFLYAVALEQLKDDAAADAALAAVAGAQPANPVQREAALRRARVLARTGRAAEAEALVKNLLGSSSAAERPKLLLARARLHADAGRALEALAAYADVLRAAPPGPDAEDAAFEKAALHEGRKEWPQAALALAGVKGPEAEYRRAQLAYRQHDAAGARAAAERVLAAHGEQPVAVDAMILLAELDLDAGRHDDALQRLGLALRRPDLGAREPAARVRRCQAMVKLRQWELAFAEAERLLLSGCPKELKGDAYAVQAECQLKHARFDEARALCQQALDAGPGKAAAVARFLRGEAYFHQQRHDDALREYLQAATLDGYPEQQALGWLQAAKCHERLGAPADAISCYVKLLDKFPAAAAAGDATLRLAALRAAKPAAQPAVVPDP